MVENMFGCSSVTTESLISILTLLRCGSLRGNCRQTENKQEGRD